uniref:Mitochondrial resolvase Ydc2 catalytic domain-containing protein n=1 Tax=viral metagenome TaxID=1070528 RepID=A0A6C0J654_9ZZZZ
MIVLSWDVGILNLAFCLIDYNTETKQWKILDWNLINLTNRNQIKCFQCGCKPALYQETNNNRIYTCKNHKKNVNCTPPTFEDVCIKIKAGTLCSFTSKKKCDKMIQYLFKNEYNYCNNHAKSEYKKLTNSYQLKEFKKKSVKSMDLEIIRLKLIRELDSRPNLLQADIVLIENQPTLKNPRMKAISSTVYDFYLIRGIIDKDRTNSTIEKVKYMCPSNKLKLADDGDSQQLVKLKGDEAKTYKLTKSLGIKYCMEMIKNFPEWTDLINSFKKKDDLADAFLQGMYHIMLK